jgi:N-acetylglucosaminyldiphosphoundecaprenol N-acetyl-beta-D-mannosaminyltransferase
MSTNTVNVLGIDFFNGQVQDVVERVKKGGLLVVPAAPALSTIDTDRQYYQSLRNADIVIPDSGYMSMLWNATNRNKINRISGLEFLVAFLADNTVKTSSQIILVDPREKEANLNLQYLRSQGFTIHDDASYVAPMYEKNKIEDPALLQLIKVKRPKYIIINLGGGVQEKLGAYLRQHLDYEPGIICTGAAIAFLTGQQATIPMWADKLFLGWFFRCLEKPKQFVPRYLKAFKLATVMIRYRFSKRYRYEYEYKSQGQVKAA